MYVAWFLNVEKKYGVAIWFAKDFKSRYIGCEDPVVWHLNTHLTKSKLLRI